MSLMPWLRIAARLSPRTMKVTSSPASASLAPTRPPMAPAPMIATFMFNPCKEKWSLLEAVAERSDARDLDLYEAARFHRADPDRRAAQNDVARIQRHVE